MNISLIKACDIKLGDLLEHPGMQIFQPVKAIDHQHGRYYFIFSGRMSRTALIDDLVLVGRGE